MFIWEGMRRVNWVFKLMQLIGYYPGLDDPTWSARKGNSVNRQQQKHITSSHYTIITPVPPAPAPPPSISFAAAFIIRRRFWVSSCHLPSRHLAQRWLTSSIAFECPGHLGWSWDSYRLACPNSCPWKTLLSWSCYRCNPCSVWCRGTPRIRWGRSRPRPPPKSSLWLLLWFPRVQVQWAVPQVHRCRSSLTHRHRAD